MKNLKLGNTLVIWDHSYVDKVTEEEMKINMTNYSETTWALHDDVEKMEEAV